METYNTSEYVIQQFELYISYLKHINENSYKIRSYVKAIPTIRSIDEELSLDMDFTKYPNIGKSIDAKIKQIIKSGKLDNLPQAFESDAKVLKTFEKIVSVGPAAARKWLKMGIRSLSELKKAIESGQVEHASVGHWIKYIDSEIQMKDSIPRSEMESLIKVIKDLLKDFDSKLLVYPCGSYRRGKLVSNDIDLILIHPDYKTLSQATSSKYLTKVVQYLSDEKMLFDHLTHHVDKLKTKYMGLIPSPTLQGVVRRIDIRLMPVESTAAALLYFTGSSELNQTMRGIAKSKNLRLNEYGIKHEDSDEYIQVSSEQDIFKILDMDYLEPNERG